MYSSVFMSQPAEQTITWEISTCCSINKQGNNRSLQEEEILEKVVGKTSN